MTNGYSWDDLPRSLADAVSPRMDWPEDGNAHVLRESAMTVIDRMRYETAKAALQGLLAASPATTQSTSNADIYAKRAVRYADALLAALNQSTEEAIHARDR